MEIVSRRVGWGCGQWFLGKVERVVAAGRMERRYKGVLCGECHYLCPSYSLTMIGTVSEQMETAGINSVPRPIGYRTDCDRHVPSRDRHRTSVRVGSQGTFTGGDQSSSAQGRRSVAHLAEVHVEWGLRR